MCSSIFSSKKRSGSFRPSAKIRISERESSLIASKYSSYASRKPGMSGRLLGSKCGPAALPRWYSSSGTFDGPTENDSFKSPGVASSRLYDKPSSPTAL